MGSALHSGIFILYLCFPNLLNAQCPPINPPCMCTPSIHAPISILCEQARSLSLILLSIQATRGLQIDSLTIRNTPMPRLEARSFDGFAIIRLALNRNTMAEIDSGAFYGTLADSLLELDLRDNLLERIPISGISQLRNLRKLYLNRNRIESVPANVFISYASRDKILKLDLSRNLITNTAIDRNSLTPLKSLEEVSLEANLFSQIPTFSSRTLPQTLRNLNLGLNNISRLDQTELDFPRLLSLSLEFNRISRIPTESFQRIPNLRYLYLTGNRFGSWDPETFRHVPSLEILGIGETPIPTIPSNAFEHIRALKRLEMSESGVDTIESEALQMAPQLQAIVLNKCRLTRVGIRTFQGLQDLYSLDLQRNRLSEIEDFAFANLPNLRHLDISNNLLEGLPRNVFQGTFLPTTDASGISLFACDNPWNCDTNLEWFRQWLRQNFSIFIDKQPMCKAVCFTPETLPPNWPLRNQDPVQLGGLTTFGDPRRFN